MKVCFCVVWAAFFGVILWFLRMYERELEKLGEEDPIDERWMG